MTDNPETIIRNKTMNHIILSVRKCFPFHYTLTCLLPVILMPFNINEIHNNIICANINEMCDKKYPCCLQQFPFDG
jgi:hypothetical protein